MIPLTHTPTCWIRVQRFAVGLAFFVLVAGIAATVHQTAAAEADRRDFPAPGNLIDVGGFKMHIFCLGEGNPTVILEARMGGSSSYWGWLQPEIAKSTRVCAYDRAGRAWSEPDPEPVTLARTARNLQTLLKNAHVEGPYVLVGHSIGGIYVRKFADEYPLEVVGMVLVDAAHPEAFVQVPDLLAESYSNARFPTIFPVLARLGIPRFYAALGGNLEFDGLPELQMSQLEALWSTPEYYVSRQAEILAGPALIIEGQGLGDLGDLPLAVISAGRNTSDTWDSLQDELAALSSNSLHITVEDATNESLAFHQDAAHEVSLAIIRVVELARAGLRPDSPP